MTRTEQEVGAAMDKIQRAKLCLVKSETKTPGMALCANGITVASNEEPIDVFSNYKLVQHITGGTEVIKITEREI